MFPPVCYIIGAQKAGTTFLATLLDQSLNVCISNPKEPHFFTQNYHLGFDWYGAKFADPSKVLVDASTTYSFIRPKNSHPAYRGDSVGLDPNAVTLMKKASPNARIIYLLRDPVDRTYSAFLHGARYSTRFQTVLDAYNNNPMIGIASNYSAQIERYFDSFREDQILFLRSSDLFTDSLGCVNRCLKFLGLPEESSINFTAAEKHESYVAKDTYRVLRRVLPNSLLQAASAEFKNGLFGRVKGILKKHLTHKAPKITPDEKSFLTAEFAAEVIRIKELTGIDFTKPGSA